MTNAIDRFWKKILDFLGKSKKFEKLTSSVYGDEFFVDRLTGTEKDATFSRNLRQEIANSLRYGDELTILCFDLYYLKQVNDGLSRHWGDRYLRDTGETLLNNSRKTDHVGRYGGGADEFLVMLPRTSIDGAEIALGRIETSLEETYGNLASDIYEHYGEEEARKKITREIKYKRRKPKKNGEETYMLKDVLGVRSAIVDVRKIISKYISGSESYRGSREELEGLIDQVYGEVESEIKRVLGIK